MGITKEKRSMKMYLKKILPSLLACSVIATSFLFSPPVKAADEPILFKTAPVGDPYEGLPLFDGNPDHFEQYLDVYMDYVGLDGMLKYALDGRGDYLLRESATFSSTYEDSSKRGQTVSWDNPNAGKRIPGSSNFTDAVQGVSTDLPSVIGMGQSWNKDLIYQMGTVMGNEKLNTTQFNTTNGSDEYLSAVNVMISAAITDIRTNPLSGRIDESFAEDPYFASVMSTLNAQGISGNTLPESDNGFWQKAFVDTKHFTNYAAQWLRREGSTYTSVRGIMEYQARSAFKGFSEGAFNAFMGSFGRTNGVPNVVSPLINYVKELSPTRVYTLNDNTAERRMALAGDFGNGYERQYVPYRVDQIIWQILADSSGSFNITVAYPNIHDYHIALIDAIQSGKYGIIADDFVEIAKDQISVLVRNGVLNERDENNLPKNYPFADKIWQNNGDVSVGSGYNSNVPAHQEIALQAAQESVVLLKNDNNLLPLSKSSDVIVTGGLADTRYRTTYALRTPPIGTNMGLSPLGGIKAVSGKDVVPYTSGGKKIAIQASNGKYLSAAANNAVTATSDTLGSSQTAVFEVYPFGQADSASLRVMDNAITAQNGRWLQIGPSLTTAAAGNFEVSGMTSGFASAPGPVGVVRREYQPDNRVRYVGNAYSTSFSSLFETQYYNAARYINLTNPATGEVGQTDVLGSARGTEGSFVASADRFRTNTTLFKEVKIEDAGEAVSQNHDYAVVVVGAATRHSQGEGADRIDMDLGREQYELVANVAAKYPGKTVVVLKTSSPVLMKEIQNNNQVAAVLYQPYAGQYDGYALGQVLYGDYAPTGRLTTTWYDDMSALPSITQNSIGEGVERNLASTGTKLLALEDIDPAFKYELNNSDPADTHLTYMYTDAEVTYPFGYGLGYSTFGYSNLKIPSTIQTTDGKFDVTMDVTNTGSVNTSEVVQLYVSANNAPYGSHVPKKQLVSFGKIAINAGETETVTLEVDPIDFAIWNTNKSKMSVITGDYTFSVGQSSEDIKFNKEAYLNGEDLGSLDVATTPIDVFANSFATSNLTYREGSRQGTMDSLKADNVTTGFYSVMSKEEGAWAGIKNVNLEGVTKLTLSVASKDAAGNIEIHLDLPNGPLLAVAEVPVTSPTNYNLGSSDVGVTELGYVNVAANFENNVTGTHDVYLVFKDPELLVSTISADSTPPTGDNVTGILTGQVQVNAGASLDVKYGLESVVGLSVLAEDITVTYDPTKMDFISIYSIDESKYRIVGQQPDAENGKIRFLAVRFGDAQTNPNGNMANLQFKTKKNAEAGISNISISNAVIGDEQGQETTIEGSTYSVQINVIDRGALESLISEAEALYSSAVEGTRIGQYPAGSKRLLRTEIDQALSVFNDDNATGVDIQQSATALNEAMQTFKNAVITSVGGDSNGDNQLTVGDLALVAKAYGMKSTDAGWNLVKQNDFNNDRKIDIEDIVWLALKIFNW